MGKGKKIKPTCLKDINEKLDDDLVYFMDEPEVYVVIADVTQEEAYKAIRLVEGDLAGIDYFDEEDGIDFFRLEPVTFKTAPAPNGEDGNWYWWGSYPKGAKFLTKGWIYRI